METPRIEDVASSIVREYLFRKGLTRTLASMEEELPRNADCINSRLTLVHELHMEKLMKKNKVGHSPLRSILEVIARFFLEKAADGVASNTDIRRKSRGEAIARKKSNSELRYKRSSQQTVNTDFLQNDQHKRDARLRIRKVDDLMRVGSGLILQDLGSSTGRSRLSDRKDRSHGYGKSRSYMEYDSAEASGYGRDGMQASQEAVRAPILDASMEARLEERVDGPSADNNNNANNNNVLAVEGQEEEEEEEEVGPEGRSSGKRNSIEIGSGIIRSKQEALVASYRLQKEVDLGEPLVASGANRGFQVLGTKAKSPQQHNNNSEMARKKEASRRGVTRMEEIICQDLELEDWGCWVPPPSSGKKKVGSSAVDMGTPVGLEVASQLRQLMFGTTAQSFGVGWLGQGLTFNSHPSLLYGIVQKKGGPCGVLAAVQAYILKALMYGSESKPDFRARDPLAPETDETRTALALALCDILWSCGQKTKAIVALCGGRAQQFVGLGRYNSDGVTESLSLREFGDRQSLLGYLQEHVGHFTVDGGHGCILALYSALLSRGIQEVREDMDVSSGTLMGAHGYCSQEMVNLLLTGKAASNVFDDVIELDSGGQDKAVLKGIQHTSDIGFLSLFEHYNSCEVGSHLKCPRFPIWVVCSESHFSVLFSTNMDLVQDWSPESRFDLYYYDGLAKQEDQIKLTIDTTKRVSRREEELVPPLENCIQTKWKEAAVDWNGYEPIL